MRVYISHFTSKITQANLKYFKKVIWLPLGKFPTVLTRCAYAVRYGNLNVLGGGGYITARKYNTVVSFYVALFCVVPETPI